VNQAEYRSRLPRTWDALLARHGSANEVQLTAADPLFAGRDVLICAPTASGKTEAYLAPLCERYCDVQGEDGVPRVLLVSPTRALSNDLYRRVHGSLARCRIAVGRWTGDHHDGGCLQPVSVLTPEALDARLSRSRKALESVRAIVLDELHVLDGTARGDQLRVLVERLRHGQSVQVTAASATVPDPEATARRYMRDPVVVAVGHRRKILARILVADGPVQTGEVLEEEVERGFRKVLAFASSRENVETYAQALRGRPPFGDAVFAHHGSLARSHRLQVEEQFLRRPVALCIATSTLELGIDIGDIDLVALLGPPPDVSSMMQRAGRGGRRNQKNPVLCIARGGVDERIFRLMLRSQSEGTWLAEPYHFRPGVLPQQAISLLHENPARWVSAKALFARLPSELRETWDVSRLDRMLLHLVDQRYLERGSEGRFSLGQKGEQNWSRSRFHANLEPKDEVEVRDYLTGDAVGSVTQLEGPALQVGGRNRQVLREEGGIAVTRSGGGLAIASFGGGPRPAMSRDMAMAILADLEIPVPSRTFASGHVLFHGLGTAGGALLAGVFKKTHTPVHHVGPLAVILFEMPVDWPSPEPVERALGEAHDGMARALGMGAWHGLLAENERKAAVRQMAEVDAVKAFLAAGRPPEIQREGLSEVAWW